jgi:hypothetical protein
MSRRRTMRPTVTELSTAWVGVSGNVAMVFRLPARSDSRGSHRGRPHEFIGIVVRRDESGVPSSPREPSSVSGGGQRDRNRADIAGCQSTAANGRPVPRLAMYPARGSAHERTPRAEARTNATNLRVVWRVQSPDHGIADNNSKVSAGCGPTLRGQLWLAPPSMSGVAQ